MKMKSLLLLHICFAFTAMANAQTIPKSIEKTVVPKTQKKVVAKQRTVIIKKSKDSDGDGLMDKIDGCPSVKGTPKYNGCPEPKKPGIVLPEMVYVSAGSFNAPSENGGVKAGKFHRVTLSGFYMGKYEITQEQWLSVMGDNPSHFNDCATCPVENISWEETQTFLTTLNFKTGKQFRLPTDAEWKYAALGGQDYLYSGSNLIDDVAWYNTNSENKTHPVGKKLPNKYGLYDMTGNVAEFVNDWMGAQDQYDQINPQGPKSGKYRLRSSGNWSSPNYFSEVLINFPGLPYDRNKYTGFRVVILQ